MTTTAENIREAYLANHARAMAALEAITAAIHDLPAPDRDDLNYGHVGDMARIARELEEITAP